MKLWQKMLLGLGLGIIAGIILGPQAQYLKPVGSLFLGLLNMLVLLLVFSSMTVGVTSIRDFKKLGRVGMKTLGLYLATTAVAIMFGLVMAKLISPGVGINLTHDHIEVSTGRPELITAFLSLIPSNPIASFASGNILQVIVFSIFLGLAITFAGE